MTVLSDTEIRAKLDSGEIVIYPLLDSRQIHETKVDLRLDNVIYLIRHIETPYYDPMVYVNSSYKEEPADYTEPHIIPFGKGFTLHPNEFALAPAFEFVKLSEGLVGRLDGRSSLGRLGIQVHSTAGMVDPGYTGPLVVELANVGKLPVMLYPLMRIATISIETIEGKVENSYNVNRDKYGGKKQFEEPNALLSVRSRLYKDEDLNYIKQLENSL